MDESARQDYPAIVGSLTPGQAVGVFSERVRHIGKVNLDIATWLQERRRVEEVYVQALRKLGKFTPPESHTDLGIFTAPWDRIISSIDSIADAHHNFANRLAADVEEPLRSWVSRNKEAQGMTTIQGNLSNMAKEIDDAQSSSDKLARKGSKANTGKIDNAQEKLGLAVSQWESQAPYVFEKLQAMDEARINNLRNLLTQYQTLESDKISQCQRDAESTLIALVDLDAAEEIRKFAEKKTSKSKPKLRQAPSHRASTSGGGASIAARPSITSTGSSTLAPPGARSSADDGVSQHSGRNDGPSESKPKVLKRFGTMLGRRRQSIQGSFQRAPSPSKSGFSALTPFGSRGNASRDGRPAPSPRASSNDLRQSPSRDNRLSALAEAPTSPMSNSTEQGRSNITNGDTTGNVPGASGSFSTANGALQKGLADFSDVQPPPGPPPSHLKSMEPLKKDTDGFSVPSSSFDPISLAQQEAADENDQQQFKLDIKNDPIHEEGADAQAALANVANTLRSASIVPPSRKIGTTRGRRDVRNTIYVPNPETSDLSRSIDNVNPESPVPQSATRVAALSTEPSNFSDTQSIRSAHSLASLAANKHPEMHEPGLNSSIIETVSAQFEDGQVKAVTVSGDMSLVYNTEGDSIPADTLRIRLSNFPALEAIGPHGGIVENVTPPSPGDYLLSLSHLTRTQNAFRYKVHIDAENMSSFAPITLNTAWKPTSPDKLGVIIEYTLNPTFSDQEIIVKGLVLLVSYEGARGISCQSKPTATFLKEKNLAYWRLGDVTLVPGQMQKVVARFTGAEGEQPTKGSAEARWEVEGGNSTEAKDGGSGNVIGSGLGIEWLEKEAAGNGKGKAVDNPFEEEGDTAAAGADDEDEGKWKRVESLRRLMGGKYECK